MDLEKIVKAAQVSALAISKLPIGEYFHVLEMTWVHGYYGETLMVTLADARKFYLPGSLSRKIKEAALSVKPSDRWSIAFIGFREVPEREGAGIRIPLVDIKKMPDTGLLQNNTEDADNFEIVDEDLGRDTVDWVD